MEFTYIAIVAVCVLLAGGALYRNRSKVESVVTKVQDDAAKIRDAADHLKL
jgi:outer membrane murein-binding lipoprotein Lpp